MVEEVSSKNTKKEILEAYERLKQELQEKEESTPDSEEK